MSAASADQFRADAVAAHREGRLAEAAAGYRSLIEADPRDADALHLLGVLHDAQGEPARAAALIEAALDVRALAGYCCNYAMVLGHLGRHQEAVAAARRALASRPDYPEALNNLGVSLAALGRGADARAAWRAAVAARPHYAEAWTNLGQALHRLDFHEEAEAALRRVVALRPADAGAYRSLALVLDEQDRPHEALALLDLAIGLRPDDAEAHHHRAMLLLRQGRFAQGWAEYDWRFRIGQAAGAFRAAGVRVGAPWAGDPIEGRTILLSPEQGLGDTIQFCRYAPLVAARGARVLLGAPGPLARLLRASFPGLEVIAEREAVPEHDRHCPLLSLPRAFATTAATVPAALPYLAPPPGALEHWRQRLPETDGVRRVGLVWAGNPDHPNDRRRSLAFAELAPLWEVAGVRWHSLQVGPRAADLASAPAGLIEDLAPELHDLAETAAALLRLDLVVTPDTAVAHLAGALGVPALVLLSFATDWRWLRGQDASPWYPGMRLIRQDERRSWRPVIETVAARINKLQSRSSMRIGNVRSRLPVA